jgi:tRNA A-37 threonylcarbamoyl transferase component Bud32
MPRPRAPWWIIAFAACALGFIGLQLYAELGGPGAFGVSLHFEGGHAVVVDLLPGYPAANAGLKPGDRIVTAGGLQPRTLFTWRQAAENAEVGKPYLLLVERDGQQLEIRLSFDAHWRRWTSGVWLTFFAKLTSQLVCIGLALLIAFRGPPDRVARMGAWLLVTLAITDLQPIAAIDPHVPALPSGAGALWRALPIWLGAPLWIGGLNFAVGPVVVMAFFSIFPRPALRSKRARWIFWTVWSAVLLPAVPLLIGWMVVSVYMPGSAWTTPDWLIPYIGVLVVLAIASAISMLASNYRRLSDPNERRRIRVLALGTVVGMAGSTPGSMADFFSLPADLQLVVRSPAWRTAASLVSLVLPISFAYAILRHRVFDIGVMIRQGLQYALARGLAGAIVPACGVGLVVDLLVNSDQPLRAVLVSRGWVYASIAGAALIARHRQRQWLDAIDRRFFRERYDARALLREVVEQVREAGSIEQAAPQVVSRIEAALHPEFASVLVRAPREAIYRVLAASPESAASLSLPADSKLVALVRLLGKPVDTAPGDSGWLKGQLPHSETEFLRAARIGLLVPIATVEGRPEALLALGTKRSEEPYSREDQELLVAIAASLGLLVDRPVARVTTDAFEECPRCGACYDSGAGSCAREGATLAIVPLQRLLGGRYRLERRLGRGGMGTVYEASDTLLERRVAAKVIREDLVGSMEAAERFRRESRAAAAFSHPNVVTVHDFGIAANSRAYLVMELLRGMSLREALRAERRLEPKRAAAILTDLCAGVDAAHQRQLVHRDLKPENVFLTPEGQSERVKVLDFGIAKFLVGGDDMSTATGSGQIIGTLTYMGPEQLFGGVVEASWDLWAVGVIAYEMLTGRLPFAPTSGAAYHNAVIAGRFTPVSVHLPEAPPRLQEFFERAFSVEAAVRPHPAPHIAAEFERALE